MRHFKMSHFLCRILFSILSVVFLHCGPCCLAGMGPAMGSMVNGGETVVQYLTGTQWDAGTMNAYEIIQVWRLSIYPQYELC